MMKRKRFAVLVFLLTISTFSLFAMTGFGGEGSVTFNTENHPYWSVGVSAKPFNLPFSFTLSADFDGLHEGIYGAGLNAYWWMMNPKLFGMLHYYVGPGFAFSLFPKTGTNDEFGIFLGTGLMAGLNIFLWEPVEFYTQVNTDFGVIRYGGKWLPSLRVPIKMGLRFWW